MARPVFYPGDDSLVTGPTGLPFAGSPVRVYTAQTGGTQITDLVYVDAAGTVGAAVPSGVLRSDADGFIPAFGGPDGGPTTVWVDIGYRGRRLALSADVAGAVGSVVPYTQPFELMPAFVYGHSYTNGGPYVTTAARWPDRVAARLRTAALTNNGVSGSTMTQIAIRALTTWTPGSRGLVMTMGIVNSLQYSETVQTCAEQLRVLLATLQAAAKYEETSTILGYNGTWSAGPTTNVSGSASKTTTTVGDYVDLYLDTGSAYLVTQMSAADGGTITATIAGTGATIGTWTTTGYAPHNAGSVINGPMVLPILGRAAGTTVRLTLTAGTRFTVDAVLVPNATNPPRVIFVEEGPSNAYGIDNGNTVDQNNTLLAGTWIPAMNAVAATFPNVTAVAVGPAGWDRTTMISPDGLHPNDAGMLFIADVTSRALLSATGQAVDGLNLMTPTPTITAGVPGYYVGSPTVPPAPTAPAVGVVRSSSVTATTTPSGTGGSPITGYSWRYRAVGGGAYTSGGTTAGTSLTQTGLTDGTQYEFQAAATNSVGTSAYSATGTSGTFFVNDTMTGTDATDITAHTGETGATWSKGFFTQGTAVLASNKAALTSSSAGNQTCVWTASGTPSTADYSVTADFKWTTVGVAGVLARASASAQTWYSFGGSATTFSMARNYTAALGAAVTPSGGISTSDTYQLTITVQGTTISGMVKRLSDNQYLTSAGAWQAGAAYCCTASDANITAAGRAGLYLGHPCVVTADNFNAG